MKVERNEIPSAAASFRVEDNFYAEAEALRLQIDESFSAREQAGITPLTYVFAEKRYQFLTASVETVLAKDSLHQLVETLAAWGETELGTSHVSTPQLRVFIAGCERSVLEDAVMLGWHYMLSLTRSKRSRKTDRVRIVVRDGPRREGAFLDACDLVDSEMTFNRLILHGTQNAYGIETVQTSMNPLEGTIFLDGYLW